MLGATVTHLINDPVSQLIRPIIFLIFIGVIYYINYLLKKNR